MNTLLRFFTAGTAIFVICCIACKESDKTPTEKLITPQCWQLTAKETKVLIWVPSLKECEKDDCWKFSKDGTFTIDRDTSLCNPVDGQFATGNWTMNTDETRLTLDLDGKSTEYNITEIKDRRLILTGGSPENRLTFTRKN